MGYKLITMYGGECTKTIGLNDIDPISLDNLVDLTPNERIEIGKQCYSVKELYKWTIQKNTNPLTNLQLSMNELTLIRNTFYNLPLSPDVIDILKEHITKDEFAYFTFPKHVQHNRDVALQAVKMFAQIFTYLPDNFKDDDEIINIAIKQNPSLIIYASQRFKNNYNNQISTEQ